jgi:hypothetical protein
MPHDTITLCNTFTDEDKSLETLKPGPNVIITLGQ